MIATIVAIAIAVRNPLGLSLVISMSDHNCKGNRKSKFHGVYTLSLTIVDGGGNLDFTSAYHPQLSIIPLKINPCYVQS